MTGLSGLHTAALEFARGNRLVIHGVNIEVPRGEVTALLGPNGSGKSTLLHLIVGALHSSTGETRLDGADLRSMRRRDRARRVALVEQEWVAVEGMRARDIVALGRVPYQGWWSTGSGMDDDDIVEESIRRAGALAVADQDAATLSGGERQRVNVARALAQQPSLLLCDEPTNHLDIRAQLDTLALLRTLARSGLAVFASLHDLNHAAAFADQVVVIADGTVRAAGTPQRVLTRSLIREVWGVDAEVIPRPGSDRRLIVFDSAEAEAEGARLLTTDEGARRRPRDLAG